MRASNKGPRINVQDSEGINGTVADAPDFTNLIVKTRQRFNRVKQRVELVEVDEDGHAIRVIDYRAATATERAKFL